MRVLHVIHQFPPFSSQGSETYCDNLARRLAATDDVCVFHTANAARRWPKRLVRTAIDGLAVYHCIDAAEYARLADWPNRFLRRSFARALAERVPEVVHFHNYISLADDLPSLARASGAAVVYTLHDYGLICPNTFLLRDDGRLCDKADPEFFERCCPVPIRTPGQYVGSRLAVFPSLARWRRFAANHPNAAARAALLAAVDLAQRVSGDSRVADLARKRAFFLDHTRRIFRDVDLFLAPSRFLLDRYTHCGLLEGKVAYLRNGMRLFARPDGRPRSSVVQFGYIGAFHPQKGLDLLIHAFADLGARANLHVYGSPFGSPIAKNHVRALSDRPRPGVTFHGRYDNADLPAILGSLDVVIVPSRWYENAPLTIQEAFIAGVPVVTADQGGMAELVQDGISGLHFRLGDAHDLREKLLRIVNHPEMVDSFRRNVPPVPGMDEHAAEIRRRYLALLARPGRAPAPQTTAD